MVQLLPLIYVINYNHVYLILVLFVVVPCVRPKPAYDRTSKTFQSQTYTDKFNTA